jgi:uncharacterized protein (TIGR00106 family)
MAMIQVSIIPVGTGSASLGDWVAETVRVAQKHGVKFELNAMGTNLEGDLDELLQVAREMHEAPFLKGAQRVITTIHIDDRRDKEITMEYKVQSVLKRV